MPVNIEIKARVGSVDAVVELASRIATSGPFELDQDDTFFHCERGRLKIRAFGGGQGELIFYQRGDEAGPKASDYMIAQTPEPDTLRELLSQAYGQAGRVRKKRTLFLVGRTRVHLDRVEGLGDFLELEVVLQDGDSLEAGIEEAHRLMGQLGVHPSQLIQGAYVDLLQRG